MKAHDMNTVEEGAVNYLCGVHFESLMFRELQLKCLKLPIVTCCIICLVLRTSVVCISINPSGSMQQKKTVNPSDCT